LKEYRIGLIVNPIAGMGGKVGLKGTDGVLEQAKKLGAIPIAPKKTIQMLKEFKKNNPHENTIHWFTCAGDMGYSQLKKTGFIQIDVIYQPKSKLTTPKDTKNAAQILLKHSIDLLIFCGGDGTARDIFSVVDKTIPLIGIPSGVKMHSAVFGVTTSASAKILNDFIDNRLTIGDVEIMDLDEEKYRNGEWNIRLFGIAKGIIEPTYIQVGKTTYESMSDDAIKEELADHLADEIKTHPKHLFLFGSGGTIDYIANHLNIENTLLGIDAVYQKKTIQKDLNEKDILTLINKYPKTKLILSPIGAQGFIIGRGNLQLSPRIIREIRIDNIIIVSTPSKLIHTPMLRVDTGDKKLDKNFSEQEFMLVIIGYRLSRVVRIQTNNY
jgi:predicted polyphosphate/ATP-dependent NAD kinase